jgi:hypothetical protein
MLKPEQQKVLCEENKPAVVTTQEDITETKEPFDSATESLMPELEELVKKNPNRLIGCGG